MLTVHLMASSIHRSMFLIHTLFLRIRSKTITMMTMIHSDEVSYTIRSLALRT